jgi:hypothetical protein
MSLWTPEYGLQKPPPGTMVNPAYAGEFGLVGSWLLNEGAGVVLNNGVKSGLPAAFTGAPVWRSGKYGPEVYIVPTIQSITAPLGYVLSGLQPLTVAVCARVDAAVTDGCAIFSLDAAAGFDPFLVDYPTDGTVRIQNWDGTNNPYVDTGINIVDAKYHTFVGTRGNGQLNLYMDGRLIGGPVTDTTTTFQGSPSTLVFGRRNDAFNATMTGAIVWGLACTKVLSAQVVARLSADPFFLYRPSPKWWFYGATGGAATQTVYPGLAALAAQAFALTATPGAVTVSPALAAHAAAALAPTAQPGAITASPAIATSTAAALALTAVPGAVTVSPALAASLAAALAATAQPGPVTVSPALAQSLAAALAATAQPGAVTASPGLAASASAAFALTAQPGAVTASPGLAASAPVAQDATAIPGSVIALPLFAGRTAEAFVVTAGPGPTTASLLLAGRTPTAFDLTALPGAVTVSPALAVSIAQALGATATPGTVTVYPLPASRTAAALAATALPGTVTALVNAPLRTATAYIVDIWSAGAGIRHWLVLIDHRDTLELEDRRDALTAQDYRHTLELDDRRDTLTLQDHRDTFLTG